MTPKQIEKAIELLNEAESVLSDIEPSMSDIISGQWAFEPELLRQRIEEFLRGVE